MTRVLFSLTGGNVNMCELWKLFGLCFLVLLFQASWNVTPLILRSFLSQRFKNVPLPISRDHSLLISLSATCCHAYFIIPSLPELSPLSSTWCFVETAFRQLSEVNHGIYLIRIPVLPITQYLNYFVYFIWFSSCSLLFVFNNEYTFTLCCDQLGFWKHLSLLL